MSTLTVDLKAMKAFKAWSVLVGRLSADPASTEFFPRGHRDAVISHVAAEALSRMFVFRRARDRFYQRCVLSRAVQHYLTLPGKYAEVLAWDIPADAQEIVVSLLIEYDRRLCVEETHAKRS